MPLARLPDAAAAASTGPVRTHELELRVVELAALFNSMDPTPFLHRDLDPDAEQYLESGALEFPAGSDFRIVIHVEKMPTHDAKPLVEDALRNYFDDKAMLTRRRVRALLGEGRTCLLIGLAVLGICFLAADVLTGRASNPLLQLARESLLIGGWVAMWRPIQIFLYEWWPLARKVRTYQSLARAAVQIVAAKA